MTCQLKTQPPDFTGWGVFRTTDLMTARLVRPAQLSERRQYLALFPQVRLIACWREEEAWFGSAASFGDSRFHLAGAASIELVDEIQLFDTVCCRFDGQRFWFEETDRRGDPAVAGFLRTALADLQSPPDIARRGLTAEQRAAYELNFVRLAAGQDEVAGNDGSDPLRIQVDDVAARLSDSLSHAGAQLVDYLERGDGYRVTYKVGQRSYTSSVNKRDLTVQVAGICLSGEDAKFDLGSLVGVLHEGDHHGGIPAVGAQNGGMTEEEYWNFHPQRRR